MKHKYCRVGRVLFTQPDLSCNKNKQLSSWASWVKRAFGEVEVSSCTDKLLSIFAAVVMWIYVVLLSAPYSSIAAPVLYSEV